MVAVKACCAYDLPTGDEVHLPPTFRSSDEGVLHRPWVTHSALPWPAPQAHERKACGHAEQAVAEGVAVPAGAVVATVAEEGARAAPHAYQSLKMTIPRAY